MWAELESFPIIGIALAVASAAVLALGNLFQARGVNASADSSAIDSGAPARLGKSDFLRLLTTPVWLFGSVLLGAAILLQLGSLTFAPLIVVQPVGVIALVFAAILTAQATKTAPTRADVKAIATCIIGVAVFVTVAAVVSTQSTITDAQLISVLIVLAVILLATLIVRIYSHGRAVPPVMFVLLGGVYSGFVVTLGKTVILRVQTALSHHDFSLDSTNLLTIGCLVGIVISGGLSIYYVQTAHRSNRPEVVVAGLTVVDPFVAVILGITILGEASRAPWWAFVVFVAAGVAAVRGVLGLSRAEAAKERAKS